MPISSLSRQLRTVLETLPEALPLPELLGLVDDLVLECSSSEESQVLLPELEQELQDIHVDIVDHSSLFQTEVFLALLYHLIPVLPSISIITSWFDLVLRPALREPRLPYTAVNHAKELILSALRKDDDDKVGEFRRRLMDFYLLDAHNEGSGQDILEWAELDERQREKRACWKLNLEEILLTFGAERPQHFMTELYIHFETPSSRLQLLILLNLYTSTPSFQSFSPILAAHPLMSSLLSSLLLDNSSTACTIGLKLLSKLLPMFAIHAITELNQMLPRLFAIVARIMSWKERTITPLEDLSDMEVEQIPEEHDNDEPLDLRHDLAWQRLDQTFHGAVSSAPRPRRYFTFLYFLYPCNLLRFLRTPASYLVDRGFESPFSVDWDVVLNEESMHRQSEALLATHAFNPMIVRRDASSEISSDDYWTRYTVARITSEAVLLDRRNTDISIHERRSRDFAGGSPGGTRFTGSDDGATPAPIRPVKLAPESPVSLQDMITTSVALKSNLHTEIRTTSQRPSSLFAMSTSPSRTPSSSPPPPDASFVSDDGIPYHITQAISGLQRDVLLLRNELNFELWLSRENVKHIARLFQDKIISDNVETERQGLYNKLRNYRAQVIRLESELREHKRQASSAKNKYADWNTELQKKLREFREEKKAWITEAATLRTAEEKAQALFNAQGILLAEAAKEVFDLQTQKKENQHKIDRLRDYERDIQQHVKIQRLWDDDFAKFNQRGEELQSIKTQYQKMQIRLDSYERSQVEIEAHNRVLRRQTQTLEAKLSQADRRNQMKQQNILADSIGNFVAEKTAMAEANGKLRADNSELRDEVEELKAMLEVLKAHAGGTKGLVSEPRASPIDNL